MKLMKNSEEYLNTDTAQTKRMDNGDLNQNENSHKGSQGLTRLERYQLLFNYTHDAIALIEFPEGNIIDINDSFCRLLGFKYNNVLSKSIYELPSSVVIEEVRKSVHSIALNKKFHCKKSFLPFKRDQTELSFELTIDVEELNNRLYGVIVLRDITLRRQSGEELRKLSRAVNQSSSLIVITNNEGIIEYVNPKFTSVTGYALEDVVGKKPGILSSGNKSAEEYRTLWNTIKSGREWHGEFQNKKKNGEIYWELASISPVVNEEGKITHFVGVKEDITQRKLSEEEMRKAKEEAERSEKLKTEFLAQVSHEIRTPVNTILSFVSLLRDELGNTIPEELRSSFKIIDNGARRLIRTIDLILDMSQIQSGNLKIFPAEIDLEKDILDNVIFDFHSIAKTKNLQFSLENSIRNPIITGDSYTITQIFVNLIENAIKFTQKGKVEVIIFRDIHNRICVDVQDTGIGISDEYLPFLFTPFSQEETGYTRKFDGNGLGLALVANYAELNNATIRVKSRKNCGSVFTVIFE